MASSVLDSGSSSPGSGPGRGHCVAFLDTPTVPLSTQVNLMLGLPCDGLAIPLLLIIHIINIIINTIELMTLFVTSYRCQSLPFYPNPNKSSK